MASGSGVRRTRRRAPCPTGQHGGPQPTSLRAIVVSDLASGAPGPRAAAPSGHERERRAGTFRPAWPGTSLTGQLRGRVDHQLRLKVPRVRAGGGRTGRRPEPEGTGGVRDHACADSTEAPRPPDGRASHHMFLYAPAGFEPATPALGVRSSGCAACSAPVSLAAPGPPATASVCLRPGTLMSLGDVTTPHHRFRRERLGGLWAELPLHRPRQRAATRPGAPVLTAADPCIWHGCGTNLSRRQSATTVGAPTDQARVCLAALPPAFTTLPVPFDQSKLRRLARRASGTGKAVDSPTPDRVASCRSRSCSPLLAQSAGSLPKLEVRALT